MFCWHPVPGVSQQVFEDSHVAYDVYMYIMVICTPTVYTPLPKGLIFPAPAVNPNWKHRCSTQAPHDTSICFQTDLVDYGCAHPISTPEDQHGIETRRARTDGNSSSRI